MLDLVPWKNKWPDNVWAMVTVENQDIAKKRIPYLLEIPAVIRGLSIEPMLGPVLIDEWIREIQWVIVGGESGSKSRPMHPNWVRVIRDSCLDSNVAFFFKQWGNWVPSSEENRGVNIELKSRNGKIETLYVKRVSKKMAGYELDGKEWRMLPHASSG